MRHRILSCRFTLVAADDEHLSIVGAYGGVAPSFLRLGLALLRRRYATEQVLHVGPHVRLHRCWVVCRLPVEST